MLRALAPLGRRLPGARGTAFAYVADRDALQVGAVPPSIGRTVERLLAEADAALAADDRDAAADRLEKTLTLTHHPLVRDDPMRFLGALRGSAAFARASRQTPRATAEHGGNARDERSDRSGGAEGAEGAAGARRPRLLVLAHRSFGFVEPVIAGLEVRGVEVRRADLAEALPVAALSLRGILRARLDDGLLPVPAALAEDAAWADTIWVEWGHHALAWASIVDWGTARLVGRLHRFEAYTPFVHLADLGRVDTLVFVSGHIRRLVAMLLGRPDDDRADEDGDRTDAPWSSDDAGGGWATTIPNVLEVAAFDRPKTDEASVTLAQVGWNRDVKDPAWTLGLLDRLRVHDPRFRLLLVGEAPAVLPEGLERRVAEGAVELLGRRDDVPEVLRRVGWIVSSSLSEGTHEAVAEGAASRAVPIVRDWPLARPFGGAASVYPAAWIVADQDEAARRILARAGSATGTDSGDGSGAAESGNTDGERARAWIARDRDPERILSRYLDVVAPGTAPGSAGEPGA